VRSGRSRPGAGGAGALSAAEGAPTLNRLELGNSRDSRYHKIAHDPAAIEATLLAMGVRSLPRDTTEIVLDFDASDDPLHGRQEGRFFHGYYGEYCYLPLFCFAGEVILARPFACPHLSRAPPRRGAQLRPIDIDASEGRGGGGE